MAKLKSTKKFEKRYLKDALQRRHDSTKIKKKQQIRDKHKAKRNADRTQDDEDDPNGKNGKESSKKTRAFENMTVDEFFSGGFEIPERDKKKRKRGSGGLGPKQSAKKTRLSESPEVEGEGEDGSSASAGADSDQDMDIEDAGGAVDAEGDISDESDEEEVDHKEQLESLAKKDPEFYNFLKENDAELLDFEAGDFEDIDDLSGDETASKERDAETDGKLNLAIVERLEKSMDSSNSLRATKEIILAFRAAAHLNDGTDGKSYKYTITNSDVYNKVVVAALTLVPQVLKHHVPPKESASGKIRVSSDSKKFKIIAPMIKSHAASTLHLMSNLSDSKTIRLTLSSLLELLPYLLSFRKILKELVKLVASIWSDTSPDEATKISAFIVLRKLVVISDAGIIEAVLKSVYQGLVKGSRTTSIHTIKGINLVKTRQQTSGVLIRQSGTQRALDSSVNWQFTSGQPLTNKTKDSYKVVYNWQCVNSLDFWSRVLSQHCSSLREAELGKESPLRPLIYPVVQVTLGVMRLIPTAQYFPLKFQLFRSLLRISQATNTYIPLASSLFEVLTSAEMRKAPKSSTVKALDFSIAIRAGKSLLRTRVYQDGVGEQLVELFSEYFVLHCKSIAFPELALPVSVMLKRWLKEVSKKQAGNKNAKINSAILLLVQKLEANSKWVEQQRAKVDFAPNNRSGVEKFLAGIAWESSPMGAFVVGQRKIREEKEKTLEEGRKRDEAKRRKSEIADQRDLLEDEPSDDGISEASDIESD